MGQRYSRPNVSQQRKKLSSQKRTEQFAPLVVNKERNGDSVLSFLESNIDVCNEFVKMYSMQTLDQRSSSYSGQILGTLKDKKLFVKVFTSNVIEKTYNNLLVEAAIYSCVVPLLLKKHTPFLLKFLAFQECDGLFRRLKQELVYQSDLGLKTEINTLLTRLEKIEGVSPDNLQETNDKVLEKFYDSGTRAYLLVLEQIDSSTTVKYEDWIMVQRTLNVYQSVWFQLVWTLLCFEKIGLRHNDLHWTNIYVQDLGETREEVFELKTKTKTFYFRVPVRYKLLIFDYDRSTIPGFIHNTILKDLAPFGFGGETPNYGYDATRITCYTKSGLRDLEEEDPAFSSTTNSLIAFLKNFERSNGKEIPLGHNEYCNYPTKDTFVQEKRDQGLNFTKQELVFNFDYTAILTQDSFFEPLRSNEVPLVKTNMFVLPDEKTNEELRSCIRTNFPEILYRQPVSITF